MVCTVCVCSQKGLSYLLIIIMSVCVCRGSYLSWGGHENIQKVSRMASNAPRWQKELFGHLTGLEASAIPASEAWPRI
jgi:hypothetical protein